MKNYKNCILAYHPEDAYQRVYYWEYDDSKHFIFDSDFENPFYAVVQNRDSVALVKVVGYLKIFGDTTLGHKKVLKLLKNDWSYEDEKNEECIQLYVQDGGCYEI